MDEDKRTGEKPIPLNVEDYLNDLQQDILRVVKQYGWTLKFVRRPDNETPVIVIEEKDGSQVGVLEENGAINYESDIVIREES
jgi:hypothetical protein